MNALEANTLLTRAALIWNVIVPDADRAEAWAEVLTDVGFSDALTALNDHARNSRTPVTPADIMQGVHLRHVQESSQAYADRRAGAEAGFTFAADKCPHLWAAGMCGLCGTTRQLA